jgi:hypothetical protein
MAMRHLLLAVCAALAVAPPALAHGTQYRVLGLSETLVEFAYTDGETMAFAEYELFGPGEGNVAVQSGRTDRQGRVAFTPGMAGTWRIAVRDADGHRVLAQVTVAAGGIAVQRGLPDWLGAASLSANAIGGALAVQWLLARRRRRESDDGNMTEGMSAN